MTSGKTTRRQACCSLKTPRGRRCCCPKRAEGPAWHGGGKPRTPHVSLHNKGDDALSLRCRLPTCDDPTPHGGWRAA
eukprot:1676481-Alexandrium_andersonii.AAC.1